MPSATRVAVQRRPERFTGHLRAWGVEVAARALTPTRPITGQQGIYKGIYSGYLRKVSTAAFVSAWFSAVCNGPCRPGTPDDFPGKNAHFRIGGAESGALPADPAFLEILDAWPRLSPAQRVAVLAVVRQAKGGR